MHVYVYYQTTIIKDLFIIVMSFAQYCIHNSTLPIKEVSEQSVSLMVPIDADSFLILLTNNKYLCYRIRSQQIIFSGELPKQFIASQYIKPLINFRQDFIYFLNSQASICKLNFKENTAQIRTLVLPDKTFKLESIEASYQIMDPHGTFLLGRVQNTQNKTCTIFVYDWLKQVYSNALSLGPTFFNFKVSNFLDHRFAYEVEFELCAKKFVIVSEEGNKIYYNYICWNINYNQNNKTTNSSKQIGEVDQLIVLKQSSRKFIQCQYFPVVPILVDTTLYVIANHHQGFYLIRISIQENSHRKIKLKLTEQLEQKGIIKRYLGIIDGNILFTIFNLKSKHQNICTIPWNSLEKPTPNQTQIAGHLLLSVESKRDVAGNQIISNIFPSINGFSFHKYQFVCEKIVKLCRKQNPDYPSQLSIQTIYRVPKKYFYSEMSQLIGFTPGLTHEMLDLL